MLALATARRPPSRRRADPCDSRALFLCAVLPYTVLYGAWRTALLFLPDDAYYYFQVARNLAGGHGSNFDQINPTNGYHPLWCGLLTLMAWVIPARETLVIAAMLLQCVLLLVGWCCAFRALYARPTLRQALGAGCLALLITWNFYLSKAIVNGMESALLFACASAMLALFAEWCADARGITASRGAILGALLALVILVRLDAIFYAPALLVVWALRDRHELGRRAKAMALFALIPGVALLTYMLLSYRWFGIWLPVSGYVKRAVRHTHAMPTTVVAYLVFACVVAYATHRLWRGPRTHWLRLPLPDLRRRENALLASLSAFLLLYQAEAYLNRGVLLLEIWYLSQHVLWLFVAGCQLIGRLCENENRFVRRGTLVAGGAVLALLAAFSWAIRLQPSSYAAYVAARDTAKWINTHLPKATVLAGWDVGIVGYYSEARIMNLDGLMNSYEYAKVLERGEGLAFLDRKHVDYIVQYHQQGQAIFPEFGYDEPALRSRIQEAVFRLPYQFASLGEAVTTGRRRLQAYEFQVLRFQPSGSARQ